MDEKANNQKRAYTKLSFSPDDEEKIITFVKENPELYDLKNANFKNKNHKDKLWNDFAKTLDNNISGWNFFPKINYSMFRRKNNLDFLKDLIVLRNGYARYI